MKTLLLRALITGLVVTAFTSASAQVALKDDQPGVYYVKEGDTLWDIASQFLQSPWKWPRLWYSNDEIDNPHLIYPGDVIQLRRGENGEPKMVLQRGDEEQDSHQDNGVVKLSPQAREVPRDEAIPAVPLEKIQPFLQQGQVVTRQEIESAAHVVAGQAERVVFGEGDEIYARDPQDRWEDRSSSYGIYRVGEEYIDPETREILGYEAKRVGKARVTSIDEQVTTLAVTDSSESIRPGDRLFTSGDRKEVRSIFYPSGPGKKIRGDIIRFFDRLSSVATNNVVVVDRGHREGLEAGNVLDVYKAPRQVKDDVDNRFVKLPPRKSGSLLLFRVFDKVSYGLVMEAERPLKKNDLVVDPESDL